MKKYNEFVNEGFLSNMFGKLFKSLLDQFKDDPEMSKMANGSIAEIEKTKGIKEFPNILKKVSDNQAKKIAKLEDLKAVNEFIKKDISLVNILLKSAAKKYGMDRLKPEVLYKESKNNALKELFMVDKKFKKEEDFQKEFMTNLDTNIKQVLLTITKKSGMKDEDVDAKLSEGQGDEEGQVDKTQGQGDKAVQGQEVKENKLYEADAPATGTAPAGGTPETEDTKDPNAKEEPAKEEPAKEEPAKDDPIFKKVLAELATLHKSIFEPLIKKINEDVAKSGKVGNFTEFAKTVKATKNPASVQKMISKFAQLDKHQLLKVRDAQGLTKDDTPL